LVSREAVSQRSWAGEQEKEKAAELPQRLLSQIKAATKLLA